MRKKSWEAKKDAESGIRRLERQWRRLICDVIVMGCLELPKKWLGRRQVLLGLVILNMEVRQ